EAFSKNIRPQDHLILAEIYRRFSVPDADVSSKDVIAGCEKNGVKLEFTENPEDTLNIFPQMAKEGDVILVFGARNPDIPLIARKMFEKL
ncbi:MAG: hypothetical protein JXR30_00565, partial [Alphaproteobacteria bacterium]|nr:hypothetical protein [Alphaproteobacteria bacterium]